MEQQGSQLTHILSAGTLFLTMAVGGYVLLDKPFQSERLSSGLSPTQVETRLWEDPFTPIMAIEDQLNKNPLSNSNDQRARYVNETTKTKAIFLESLGARIDKSEPEAGPVILAVTLPGGRFALSTETRRRIRYAVVSALSQTHIAKNNETMVPWCVWGEQLDEDCTASDSSWDIKPKLSSKAMLISYEIFNRYHTRNEGNERSSPGITDSDVVVLWLDESKLGDDIEGKYNLLLTSIQEGWKTSQKGSDVLPIRSVLIGPSNSDALETMIRKLCDGQCLSNLSQASQQVDDEQDAISFSGKVPQTLTPDLKKVIDFATFYLDGGLSSEKAKELKECNDYWRKVDQLTYESVSTCLKGLNIVAKDRNWYREIAKDWPYEVPEEIPENLRVEVQQLLERTGSVLKGGMNIDIKLKLVSCNNYWRKELKPEEMKSSLLLCLKNIGNSSEEMGWREKLVDGEIYELREWATLELRGQLRQLVSAVGKEMVGGIKPQQRAGILACSNSWRDKGAVTLTFDNVDSCLRRIDALTFNQDWINIVASGWKFEVPESIKLGLRSDMQGLFAQVNHVLKSGFDVGVRRSVLSCESFWKDEKALTREKVRSCLSGLKLPEGVVNDQKQSKKPEDTKRAKESVEKKESDWVQEISAQWPVQLPEKYNAALRSPLQLLIRRVEGSLGLLSDADIEKLLSCNNWWERVTELTYENVSSCLKDSQMQNKSVKTQAPIASNWPHATEDSILSPQATLSKRLLADGKIENIGTPIYRTIADDEQLLVSIFSELFARNFPESDAGIALVYESDSKYGRGISKLLNLCKNRLSNFSGKEICRHLRKIDDYGYLRGIDGLRSNEAANKDAGKDKDTQNLDSLLKAQADMEEPFGNHQYDYLRRLAREIKAKDYDAIGVVGTDIFDKLLVLQALYEENRQALFFTTDMDAYLSQASQVSWTQNLLVASAFPLKPKAQNSAALCGEGAGILHAPPFRDSYQTSYFNSTCLALRMNNLDKAQLKKVVGALTKPVYLYEIGRKGAVELKPDSPERATYLDDLISEERSIAAAPSLIVLMLLLAPVIVVVTLSLWGLKTKKHQLLANASLACYPLLSALAGLALWFSLSDLNFEHNYLQWYFPLLFFSVGLEVALASGILFASSRFKKQNLSNLDRACVHCFWICTVAIILMIKLLATEYLLPGGEPTILLQGISMWPSTLIWIQILALSLCFAVYFYETVVKAASELSNVLQLVAPNDASKDDSFRKRLSVSAWLTELSCKLEMKRQFEYDRLKNQELSYQRRYAEIKLLPAVSHSAEEALFETDSDLCEGNELLYGKALKMHWHRLYGLASPSGFRWIRIGLKTAVATFVVVFTNVELARQPALVRDSFWLANRLFKPWIAGDGWWRAVSFETLATVVALFMIMVTIDSTRLTRAFCKGLLNCNLEEEFRNSPFLGLGRPIFKNSVIDRQITFIDLVEKRTEIITQLIWFPLAILCMMVLSRSSMFDGWRWNAYLVIVNAGLFAYVLGHAFALQIEVNRVRNNALSVFAGMRRSNEYLKLAEEGRKYQDKEIDDATNLLKNLNSGAFVDWYKHPIFQAMFLPTTGTTVMLVLRYLF